MTSKMCRVSAFAPVVFVLALVFQADFVRADFSLDSLSQDDVDGVSEDFAALFEHTTASPASSLGDVFGFEVGVLGGAATDPTIEKIVKATSPGSEMAMLPHMGLVGQVSIPFGVTFEAKLLPEYKNASEGMTISSQSGAVRWSFGSLLGLPFSLAAKLQATSASLETEYIVNNASTGNLDVDSKMKYDIFSTAELIMASVNLVFVEPYAGIGAIQTESDLAFRASSGTVFDSGAQKASASVSGMLMMAGAQFSMFFFKPSIEIARIYDSTRYTAKLAFGF